MNRLLLCGLVIHLCLLVTACKNTVEMQLDLGPNPAHFFVNGFPTDLRVKSDGHIDMANFPRLYHELTKLYVDTVEADSKGYSPIMPAYLPFTGPLDVPSLPVEPEAFTTPDSPVQWVDIDENSPERGRRFPLQLSMTTVADVYRPAHLLQALPTLGINLRPDTQYALIVTDRMPVSSQHGLQQSAILSRLLGDASVAPDEQNAWTQFAALRQWLQDDAIDPARIIAATVWTTGNPAKTLFDAAKDLATWPVPAYTPLQKTADYPDYCVLSGTWEVAGFQQGTAPYAYTNYGGAIEFLDNGAPVMQYVRQAPFVVTLPKRQMPEGGFPLLMYNHGTGGDSQQVYLRGKTLPDGTVEAGKGPAEIAAQRGWAASGMGGHMAPEHIGVLGSVDGYMAYNFLNPVAMRNNFLQMVLERILFRRLLGALQIDPGLCSETTLPATEPHVHFSTQMQVVMGQSLGSYIAGMQAAVDPESLQGVILTGAGGSWIEFVFGPTDPVNLQYVLEVGALQLPLLQHLDRWHPVPMLAELAMGVADNIHYADTLLRYPTKTAPHVLVVEGHHDHQVPENIQRPLLAALGVDLAGEEVGASAEDTVFPAISIGGAQQLAYPVTANRNVSGQSYRTAVVVRYEEDGTPDVDGHYVTFQRDEVKHQYGCFLQNLAEGRTPVLLQGVTQGGDCL